MVDGIDWNKCPNRTEIPILYAKMEKDIEYIKKEQKETKELMIKSHKELDCKFDKFIGKIHQQFKEHEIREMDNTKELMNNMDNKYASKYVEKVFWIVLSAIITIIVAAMMYSILK